MEGTELLTGSHRCSEPRPFAFGDSLMFCCGTDGGFQRETSFFVFWLRDSYIDQSGSVYKRLTFTGDFSVLFGVSLHNDTMQKPMYTHLGAVEG